MGRVRTKTVKKAARKLIENQFQSLSATEFEKNKQVCSDRTVARIPSKRLRNKIAGYVTTLMKRIEKGPVRGISLKLQEEEREHKDNYVPETSQFDVTNPRITTVVADMLKDLGFSDLVSTSARQERGSK